jgi:hypothetical protein
MSDIPDLQELVLTITREQLERNGLSAEHPMLYVSVTDARRMIDIMKEQQAEIERLQAALRSIPCSCYYPDPIEQSGGEEHFPPKMRCSRCAAL